MVANTINTSAINESYRYYTCPYKLTCPATLDQLAVDFHFLVMLGHESMPFMYLYCGNTGTRIVITLYMPFPHPRSIIYQIMSVSKLFRAVLSYGKFSSCHSRYSGKVT